MRNPVISNENAIRVLTSEKYRFLDNFVDYGDVAKAYDLAIESLKETEPIEPIAEAVKSVMSTYRYVCGNCHKMVYIGDNYCSNCGRKIKKIEGWF